MTCKEIIEKYLKDNNFDGLINNDAECYCNFDIGIEWCTCNYQSCNLSECVPGYNHIMTQNYKDYLDEKGIFCEVNIGDEFMLTEKELPV